MKQNETDAHPTSKGKPVTKRDRRSNYKLRELRGRSAIRHRGSLEISEDNVLRLVSGNDEEWAAHVMFQVHDCAEKLSKVSGSLLETPISLKGRDALIRNLKLAPIIHSLYTLMHYDLSNIERIFPHYKLDPFVELFIRKALTTPKLGQAIDFANSMNLAISELECTIVNGFVAGITSEVRSKKFESEIANRRRAAQKASTTVAHHIDKLFSIHRTIQFANIELRYRNANEMFESEARIPPIATQKHLRKLLDKVARQKHFNSVLTYIWKLEHSAVTGFRYQLLLFIDGSRNVTHDAIPERIAEIWKSVTDQRGISCQHKYKNNVNENSAMLRITHSKEARKELDEKVINELTDTFYHLTFKPSLKIRAHAQSTIRH